MTRETGKSIDQEHAEPHGKSTANEARPAPPPGVRGHQACTPSPPGSKKGTVSESGVAGRHLILGNVYGQFSLHSF